VLFAAIAAKFCCAQAQTVDYFETPWVVQTPAPVGENTESGGLSIDATPSQPKPSSNLYTQLAAASNVSSPPVLVSFNAGIDEVATDNVAEADTDRKADLMSIFSLGTSISADTQLLSGTIAGTGTYQRNIVDTSENQFAGYGYANARATLIPDNLFINLNGSADDVARLGGVLENSLAQSANNTHVYTAAASPVLTFEVHGIGNNSLSYQIARTWFTNNTGAIEEPGLSVGNLTPSTEQELSEDFRMPGTMLARLKTDLVLSASLDDTGSVVSGNLSQRTGEMINEYEITRSSSLIGGAGYEDLRDTEVPMASGQGVVWDAGIRLRPNVDSSFLLVYGHHDLNSDFAGELEWRVTPFTDFYARYSDSFGTVQQSLVGNTTGSLLGSDGAVTDIVYDQNPVVGVLDEQMLSAYPGEDTSLAALGVPLGISNNSSPLQSGIMRIKTLSGSARYSADDGPVVLTAYDVQDISFTPLEFPSSTTEGGNVSWSPALSEQLSGLATVNYSHELGGAPADVYGAGVGLTFLTSASWSISIRYDFIWREAPVHGAEYTQDLLTLGVHKSFD
jgi:uncharacterized protein (PEP-CTERM system associated)